MSPERDFEAAAASRVIAELTGGAEDTSPGLVEDEVAEVLRRLYVEAFGLLGYAAAPAAPRPDLKSHVLVAIAGDETQEVEPLHGPPALAASVAPEGVAVAPAPPVAAAARLAPPPAAVPAASRAAARSAAGATAPRRRRWTAVLATLFGLAAVGLGVAGAWLQSELDSANARLRRSAAELAQAETRRQQEVAAARGALADLERRHAFVTAPGVTVFALRPPALAGQPAARATLWVAADRRRWQLEAVGLRPDAADRDYQLWFLVDGIPRRGGVFEVLAGQPARLADDDLPAGTTAIWVTLERKGGAPAPTTAILLLAERAVQL